MNVVYPDYGGYTYYPNNNYTPPYNPMNRSQSLYPPLPNLRNSNYFHLNNSRRTQENFYSSNSFSVRKGVLSNKTGNVFAFNSPRSNTKNFHLTSLSMSNKHSNNNPMNSTKTPNMTNFKFSQIMNEDSSFNIDKLLANNDLSPLESVLEGLIYTKFEREEDDLGVLVKNFQQAAKYLFNMQSKLEQENQEMEENYKVLQGNAQNLDEELKMNKDIIRHYKETKRDLQFRFNVYKTIIDEHRVGNNSNILGSREKVYYYCDRCSGRKFSCPEKLQEHYMRRHPTMVRTLAINNPSSNDSMLENKMSKLKEDLTKSFSQFHKEHINKLIENNQHLEKKIEEISKTGFNSTSLGGGTGNFNQAEMKREGFIDEEKLEKKTSKIFQAVKELEVHQNEKIEGIQEQLQKFRESVINELRLMRKGSPVKEEVKVEKRSPSPKEKSPPKGNNNTGNAAKVSYNIKSYVTEKKVNPTAPIRNKIGIPINTNTNKNKEMPVITTEPEKKPEIPEINRITEESHSNSQEVITHSDPIEKIEEEKEKEINTNNNDPNQNNTNPNNTKNNPPVQPTHNYIEKMKNIYRDFFDREESDLFVEIDDIKEFKYKSIPDIEIIFKNDSKMNSVFNAAINKAKGELEYTQIESGELKAISNLIVKLSQYSMKNYQNNLIYADYRDNIELLLGIKEYLTDEKVISKEKRESLFPKVKKDELNKKTSVIPVKNTNNNNQKRDIETIQTAKFNELQLDDF